MRLCHRVEEAPGTALHHGREQARLRPEVMVDRALGDPRLLDQDRHRRAGIPLRRHHADGSVEDLLAGTATALVARRPRVAHGDSLGGHETRSRVRGNHGMRALGPGNPCGRVLTSHRRSGSSCSGPTHLACAGSLAPALECSCCPPIGRPRRGRHQPARGSRMGSFVRREPWEGQRELGRRMHY
jgi:hypothetical protein